MTPCSGSDRAGAPNEIWHAHCARTDSLAEVAIYIIKNILVPTDFSDFSAAAVEHARTFSVMYHAPIHLLHIAQEEKVNGTQRDGGGKNGHTEAGPAEKEMERFVQKWLRDIRDVHAVIRVGHPYREIVRYATEEEIDLIVIATHGRTGLPHLVMGSVAERVVRYAPGPVLAVKPKALQEEPASSIVLS